MISIVTAVLGLIEQLLPALGTSAATASLVTSVITTLEQLLPLMIDFIPTVYNTVKGIITALTADPTTTPDQLSKLQALDASIDAAFEAAAKDVDPDAPAVS